MSERTDKVRALFHAHAPGLTPLAIAVFMIAAGKSPVSMKALGKELEVPQANVLRAVAALSAAGLVAVEEKGALRKDVRLSGKGRALAEEIKGIAETQH